MQEDELHAEHNDKALVLDELARPDVVISDWPTRIHRWNAPPAFQTDGVGLEGCRRVRGGENLMVKDLLDFLTAQF